ncbi:hypothetical protein LTR85_007145 [Meristemomyces frigidus]|nr:hypothetical protein LTR85_007145 [Meristemomyces frigidus]
MARYDLAAAGNEISIASGTHAAQGNRTASPKADSAVSTAADSIFTSQGSTAALSSRTPSPLLPPHVSKKPYVCRATQTTPRFDLLLPGEPVALDIEFQTYLPIGSPKWIQRLGRPTLRNTRGHTILDVYCYYPTEKGVKKGTPPKRFNVAWPDLMKQHGAKPAQTVEKWIATIVKDRTVVVHDRRGDLTAFQYEQEAFKDSKIVDTQAVYSHLTRSRRPGLALCAEEELGIIIQEDSHSPVEDADATMQLFLKRYPDAFDHKAAQAKVRKERAAARARATGNRDTDNATVTAYHNRNHQAGSSRRNDYNRHNTDKRPAKQAGAGIRPLTGTPAEHATETKGGKKVHWADGLKVSIEDDDEFPALGAMGPGVSRR